MKENVVRIAQLLLPSGADFSEARPIVKLVLTFERVIVLVMGVAGSGKSIVAALLSAALGCQVQEGDDLHPQENLEN